MPFIPAENVAKITIVQSLFGQVITNNLYARNATGWSTEELVALADLIIAGWNDHMGPNQSNDIQYGSVLATDLTSEESAAVEIQFPALSGGDIVGDSAPGNVALAVRFKTGLRGRARTGKNFVAGIHEGVINENEVTALWRDAVVAGYGSIRNDLIGAGYEHVVVSFYDGFDLVEFPDGTTRKVPHPRDEGLVTPVESYVADLNLDSQRRRLAGRGI